MQVMVRSTIISIKILQWGTNREIEQGSNHRQIYVGRGQVSFVI